MDPQFTTKQIAVLSAMKQLKTPAGVQKIMTHAEGMDSKIQVKSVLDQLVTSGAVRFQSNEQYAIEHATLKTLQLTAIATKPAQPKQPQPKPAEKKAIAPAASTPAPVRQNTPSIRVKPEAVENRVQELQTEINTLREQLAAEQQNNQAMIANLTEIRTAVGATGWMHTDLISYLSKIHSAYHETKSTSEYSDEDAEIMRSEFEDIAQQVSYAPGNHDCLSQAVAIALDNHNITPRAALARLSEQLSDILDDDARIIITSQETPELICTGNRYEIPTGSDKETAAFFESISWICGQYIAEEAA